VARKLVGLKSLERLRIVSNPEITAETNVEVVAETNVAWDATPAA
jgi:hypothetical protein